MKNEKTLRKPAPHRLPRAARRAALAAALAGSLLAGPAHALSFNLTWDASTANAPAGFTTAFQNAIDFYQTSLTNPIVINLSVGWGEVNNTAISSGALGESTFSEIGTSYANVRNALAKAAAPGYLPASNPTGGRTIYVSTANAKALGFNLLHPNSLDGSVGFDSSATWTFNPGQRAQNGAYDFIGVAEHEISEVLGRYSALDPSCTSGASCPESVLDLYRYTQAGTLDLTGTNAYFSLDGGQTVANTFNGDTSVGDLGDWAGQTLDAFNYALPSGKELPVSQGDLQEMASLGYTLAPVPEPGQAALMFAGLGLLGWCARRKRG